MKRTNILSYLRSALMMIAVCAIALPAQALGQKELQQLLDGNGPVPTNRASNDGFTEIDLSAFTEPITETLYVRNQNIRFVNGTLTMSESLVGSLIIIQNGYSLEIASSAIIYSQRGTINDAIINVERGELLVNGGTITGKDWVNAPTNRAIPPTYNFVVSATAVELTGGKQSTFTIYSGRVDGTVSDSSDGWVSIHGGSVATVSTSTNISLWGEANVGTVILNDNAYITLWSTLQNTLGISGYTLGQMVMQGYVAIPGGAYKVTEEDVEKVTLVNNTNNYRLVLDKESTMGNVYVREAGLDYSNITNEDDLQKALDEIAAQKPSTPVEVTINPDGITLTHAICAGHDCNAIITGGTIRVGGVTSSGEALSGDDYMFLVIGTLRFQNIAIDFMQLSLKTVFRNSGNLYINDNVEYLHVIENVVHDFGSYSPMRGSFYMNCGGLWLNSGRLPHISGYVINSEVGPTIPLTTLYGNLFDNPRIKIVGGLFYFNSALESIWTFEGNWEYYMLEQPFIMGGKTYTLQASDYWQMRFTGLPSTEYNRTVYYDGSSHSIKLKNYKSLQDMMDGDEDGNVEIPCDGVDVGENYTPAQRMQWLLDGSDCPSAVIDPPAIRFPGGCMFLESPTIARFVTFDSFSSGHRLYIRNKTEFKDKVVARNFIWFSIIEQGGHLIWDNAETENILYPIYNTGGTAEVKGGNLTGTVYNAGTLILCGCVQVNEIQVMPQSIIRVTSPITSTWALDLTFDETVDYPNGCILLEGGNGYTLTVDDFAHLQFRLPAGCSVTYDPTHNIVVLNSASDIHSIQADPTATHKGVYTLDGRKLQGQAKAKGIYIVNGQKAVVK